MRRDGFAPIGDYALIGDGRSAALIAADGAIDWWAVPAMDAPPVFAAILDPDSGGAFTLEPAVPYQAERRYLPGTNVLETTFRTARGVARVVDALNRDVDGPLAWTELVREVHGGPGEVPMRWRVAAGDRFHRARPWAWRNDGHLLLQVEDQLISVVHEAAGDPQAGRAEVAGQFVARQGTEALLALAAADGEPVPVPPAARVRERLRATEASWRRWSETVAYDGPHRDLVERSALTLKLLTYSATRGLLAAATTSLPERVGGERNYDYRYGWVRDTSFALDALIRLGLQHEAHGTLSWLLRAARGTAPDIRPFYGLRGDVPAESGELGVRGYRDSRPAYDGNQAVSQQQWGNFGDLLQAVWLATSHGLAVLDPATARMLELVADRVCDVWSQPDSGIWELGTPRHYTFSKMSCWVALDRAIRLAECGQLAARDAGRWRAEATAIRDFVESNCWSPAIRSYTFYAGSAELDAAVLLAARLGYVPPTEPRFTQTIDAIRRDLHAGEELLYRFSGSREQEGAFLACSFWLADALALTGHADDARRVFERAAVRAGDLGLLSEEIDPATGELLGNTPQALSHLALLMAACQLAPGGQRTSCGDPDALNT